MYYFSPSTKAFYHTEINKNMPSDVVSLTDEQHAEIFEELGKGKGLEYIDGKIVIVEGTPRVTWKDIRSMRDKRLMNSDYTDTLSFQRRNGEAVYNLWQDYRQSLRDITKTFDDPNEVIWPIEPK